MKKRYLVFIVILLSFIAFAGNDTLIKPGSLSWKYEVGSYMDSSPAIGKDGTIYVGSWDSYLSALNPDGTLKWKYETGNGIVSSPAIGEDGTVYVGSRDSYFYAINSDGNLKWKYETGDDIRSSPAIGKDGTVYVGSDDNYLYALNPDGTLKWKYETRSDVLSSPAIGEDGTVYVGSRDNYIYAINPDGTLNWKYETGRFVDSPSIIGKNGTVYIGSRDHYLYAMNLDGTIKWKYETRDEIRSSPAIGKDGTLYFGSYDDYLYALNPDGTLKWKYETGNGIVSSPAIGKDGTLYFGSKDNYLYAINKDGTTRWKYNTRGDINSSPTIGKDGTIYFVSRDRFLYAIQSESEGLADSAWPMFRRNALHTGEVKDPYYTTVTPSPWNKSVDVKIDTILSWEYKKADSDEVIYDIYFGTNPIPPLVKENHDTNTYDPGELEYGTKYYWKIVAKYEKGIEEAGHIWTFTIAEKEFKWKYETQGVVFSSPAIGTDGTIYVGSDGHYLYANNPDSTLKWKYETGRGIYYSSPAIGKDGTVYVGSDDNYLYALNPDGTLKWKYETSSYIFSSPAVDTDGVVYIGSYDDYLYAINPDGTLRWKYETGKYVGSSPAIGKDGTIYVGSWDSYLYAINPDGTLRWKYETGNIVHSSPAIGTDGTVYVGSRDNCLYVINPDGTLNWKYETGNGIDSSPAIGIDGTIHVGSDGLYAINPDGTLKWKYETGDDIDNSSPAIGKDGTVYVGSRDSYLYALNPDGTLKWKYEIGDWINSSPAIGKDGTVYVGSNDGFLYAIQSESEGLADSAWPMFRRNARHTGEVKDPYYAAITSSPWNKSVDIKIDIILSWEYKKADSDEELYDIYFGTNPNPPLVKENHDTNVYDPGKLEYKTKYYWKITVRNKEGIKEEGPVWCFTTKEELMVLVEGGTFQMGDTWGDGQLDEKLVHEVTLTYNFYLGRYEITNEEYVEFLNDKGINEDGSYNGKELIDMDDPDCQIKHNVYEFYIPDNLKNNPVIEVSWWGGIYYCNWLSEKEGLPKAYDEEGNLLDKNGNVTTDITKVKGYRLPTEAEWEFAARGGNESKGYKYAGSDDPDEVAWYLSNSEWHTHNVGTKKPNELGIYDMSGNVQERCQDVYAYYEISPETNPYNYYKTSSHRVVRGGSWPDSASDVRVANRYYGKPDYSYYNSGFRICRTAY